MAKNVSPKAQKHQAPIIKKKLHMEEAGGHGGVWKIAYADFMTAMMTFFLVMWLINSASKEKIIQLANYFNPVKLSDRSPSAKGVRESQKSGAEVEKAPQEPRKSPKRTVPRRAPRTTPSRARNLIRRHGTPTKKIFSGILLACSLNSLPRRRGRWRP